MIDAQRIQGFLCDIDINDAISLHLRKITHPFQHPVSNTRGPAGTLGHFFHRLFIRRHSQKLRGTTYDFLQFLGRIHLELAAHSETVS